MGTIKKMFPELSTSDYFEIGKMCMDEKMPRNSESQMQSLVIQWMKKHTPEVKYLYTWADGIVERLDMCIRQQTFCMVVLYGVMYMSQMRVKRYTFAQFSVR